MRNGIQDFFEEAKNEELVSHFAGDASGAHVIELSGLDVATSGAVRAFDIIGFDFEAGQSGGFGVFREEQIAIRLVRIGLLRFFFDAYETGEDGVGVIEENIFKE